MAVEALMRCPECGAELKSGYLGYGSGLLWHERPLRGLVRFFPFAIATGHFVLGNRTSSGFFTSRLARKCERCGTVVIPS